MTLNRTRWFGALLVSLAGLTIASFLLRGETVEVQAPKRVAPVVSSYGSLPQTEPAVLMDPIEGPPPPEFVGAARGPVEHRKARDEGYREAREATWEGTLSGQVVSPEGPLTNMTVRVEWVLALQPDHAEIAKLKRAGARRDKDGAWWARTLAMTDETGCFHIEGLPAVPLRLHAGNTTQQAQVGAFTQIRTDRP